MKQKPGPPVFSFFLLNVASISSSSSVQGVEVVEVMEVVTVAQHGHLQEGAGGLEAINSALSLEDTPKAFVGRHA